MAGYDVPTSTEESTYTITTTNVSETATADYAKQGNGYARITLLSVKEFDKEYTINYELNGGTATNPTTYTSETNDFVLNNPTKANSTFLGWTEENDILLTRQGNEIQYSSADYVYFGPYYHVTQGYYRIDVYGENLDKVNGWFSAREWTTDNIINISTTVLSSNHAVIIAQAVHDTSYLGLEIMVQKSTEDVVVTREEIRRINNNVTVTKGSVGNKNYTANWN